VRKLAWVLLVISLLGQIATAPLFIQGRLSPPVVDFVTNELSWLALSYTAALFLYETRKRQDGDR
jgi:hypothetical protein